MVTTLDLKEIASRGGGMIIDSSSVTSLDLKEIASRASSGGGTVIVKNAKKLTSLDCKEISSRGQGRVILDFT